MTKFLRYIFSKVPYINILVRFSICVYGFLMYDQLVLNSSMLDSNMQEIRKIKRTQFFKKILGFIS